MKTDRAAYGPVQMQDRLGLTQFQFDRALTAGLIPSRDRSKGWSAVVVDDLAERVDTIRAAVGSIPDLGASRAAEILTDRLGVQVTSDAIGELAARGLLTVAGTYKDCPIYCGQSLERFTDIDAAVAASRDGELLTSDESAARLRIRRPDFDHLVRAGLLSPARYGKSMWQRRSDAPNVPLFRAADLDTVEQRVDIDWEQVRSTPKGRQSPLAALPTAEAVTS